jgi:hypothetical protein
MLAAMAPTPLPSPALALDVRDSATAAHCSPGRRYETPFQRELREEEECDRF